MSNGLDVIIVDDEPNVCHLTTEIVKRFYSWGEVISYCDADQALTNCLAHDVGIAIFIVDVFLDKMSGFMFLEKLEHKFPAIYEDTVMITGHASDDVVNMCIASEVNYLLEKPVKSYALQLSVRAIAQKYLKFAKRLMQDSTLADNIINI